MATSKAYRPNVDLTAATEITVPTSPVNSKTAFIPNTMLVDDTGEAIGTGDNPLVVSGGGGGGGGMTQSEFLAALRSPTGTKTAVASGITSVTILAANANRKGATITNTDANALYLDLSGATASSTSYTVAVATGGYYEVPFGYSGNITGIWAADGTGSALVTEFT